MLAVDRLALAADPAHLDELEAERLDLLENPVERGLVGDVPPQDRLHRLHLRLESLEARE